MAELIWQPLTNARKAVFCLSGLILAIPHSLKDTAKIRIISDMTKFLDTLAEFDNLADYIHQTYCIATGLLRMNYGKTTSRQPTNRQTSINDWDNRHHEHQHGGKTR